MWAFLSRRFRMWLFFAVGAPVFGWLLRKVSETLEARGGETSLSRGMRGAGDWLRRRERGPVARRRRAEQERRLVDGQDSA